MVSKYGKSIIESLKYAGSTGGYMQYLIDNLAEKMAGEKMLRSMQVHSVPLKNYSEEKVYLTTEQLSPAMDDKNDAVWNPWEWSKLNEVKLTLVNGVYE